MSELVEKLRSGAVNNRPTITLGGVIHYASCLEAADHIQHLEEIKTTLTKQAMEQQLENEELKDALKRLGESDTNPISGIEGVDLVGLPFLLKEIKAMREYANKALQGKG